jgi:hypothetical protein
MSFWNSITKIKIPDSKKMVEIPKKLKYESKKIDLNTVDVLYLSNQFKFASLHIGQKIVGKTNYPIINLTLPDNLKFFGKYPIFNKSSNRELYLISENSPYDMDISKTPQTSSKINVENKQENKIEEMNLTQSLLNELGNFKMIQDINEKSNDGFVIIFLMGILIGGLFSSFIMGYILS